MIRKRRKQKLPSFFLIHICYLLAVFPHFINYIGRFQYLCPSAETENPGMRKGIRLASGQQLSWNRLKQIYKNIESGFGDQQIARAESRHRNGLLSYATATQDEFDNAVDTLVDYEKKMSSGNGREHLSLTEYYVWQEALYTFIENAVKYLPKKLPEQYRGLYLGTTVADSPHRNASIACSIRCGSIPIYRCVVAALLCCSSL